METDLFYEELQEIKYWLDKQPSAKVKVSKIREPYKKYFIKYIKIFKLKVKRFLRNSSV